MRTIRFFGLIGLVILLLVLVSPVIARSKPKHSPTRTEVLSYALPNPALTPGQVSSTLRKSDICQGIEEKRNQHRDKVLKRYGISQSEAKKYWIDHLVSLELGGTSDISNLWPQLKEEEKVKDKLENRLKQNLCGGSLTLEQAQSLVIQDWRAAYIKNFIDGLPLP
jgi:hypothetical protein